MKKTLTLFLALIMIISAVMLVSCGSKSTDAKDTTKAGDTTKSTDSAETTVPDSYDSTPIDTSAIKSGEGGDIVGTWVSDTMYQTMQSNNGPVDMTYYTTFVFNSDGTCSFHMSLIPDDPYHAASYTVSDGKLDITGEGLKISNATYTVDGDILLISSDTLNAAFRRK